MIYPLPTLLEGEDYFLEGHPKNYTKLCSWHPPSSRTDWQWHRRSQVGRFSPEKFVQPWIFTLKAVCKGETCFHHVFYSQIHCLERFFSCTNTILHFCSLSSLLVFPLKGFPHSVPLMPILFLPICKHTVLSHQAVSVGPRRCFCPVCIILKRSIYSLP